MDTRLIDDDEPEPTPQDIEAFANKSPWLDDWALFHAIRTHLSVRGWWDFPPELRRRDPEAIAHWTEKLADQIRAERRDQCRVSQQWSAIKTYAEEAGVKIIGDLPIFVCRDGADTWTHRHLFCFDASERPDPTTGAPPDDFSSTGQWWNNPHYDWPAHSKENFSWWIARVRLSMGRHHTIRIDHFRGLISAWAIPAEARGDARQGTWRDTPGHALTAALASAIPELDAIAEDLGDITEEVIQLRTSLSWPGMKILQFAFDSAESIYRPPYTTTDWVVYPGTHDNDTAHGWYQNAEPETRRRFEAHLGLSGSCPRPAQAMLEVAWASEAMWAIAPLQDILELDSTARMNTPGTKNGNWHWVCEALPHPQALKALNRRTSRATEEV